MIESNVVEPVSEFSVVSQEHIMNRLNTALNDMRVSYDEVEIEWKIKYRMHVQSCVLNVK